jgi:hypothetical protein
VQRNYELVNTNQDESEDVVFGYNIFSYSGNGKQAAALLPAKNSLPVELKNNIITGQSEREATKEDK